MDPGEIKLDFGLARLAITIYVDMSFNVLATISEKGGNLVIRTSSEAARAST